ncbi:MAG: serine/threonine-protein kinase, partial [Gemmatimonas sp.]
MTHDSGSVLIGTIIADRYRIIKRVGEGGMGQVFLAEHIRMKRKSAIKIMRSALVGDAEALQRFTREAENASKLSHPNVASIFDFGETADGLVYLAMEFIEGESLHATLTREVALHPMVAADVIGQAADALQAAHELGILHRDLKPDNLMLSKRTDGTYLVKLVDFGIARTMDSGATRVTRTGFAVGTPEYMSPEQLAGDVLDARSDQYALALVAFAALTGQEAFSDSSAKDSLILRLTSRPRRLAEVRSDIDWPVTLQSVFDRALAPDSADRYPRIADFADELANAISLMTPSQTAEMYGRALLGRGVGAARRTPSIDQPTVSRPADRSKTPAMVAATTAREVPTARAIGMPDAPKRRLFPVLLLVGLFVYGLHWYGAKQPAGAARRIADSIASGSRMIAGPLLPYIERMRRAATDSVSTPVATPTPRKRAARVKRDSVASDTTPPRDT